MDMDAIADLLTAVLEGSVDAKAAAKRLWETWERTDKHPSIEAIAANFEHFAADSDIRARDVAYKELQEVELRKLISALRRGDIARAGNVSFLHNSES